MVYFKVRSDSLSEVAALIGNVVVTFDSNLASADQVVARMAGTTWVGEDAEKFGENWDTFMTFAGQVRLALTALQQGLISADGSYTQTESGVGGSFRGRQQGLVTMRNATGGLGKRVASGEEKAEDMAEFFGRDYAGDNEVEQFGGGMLGSRKTGQATGGGPGDTDGDGDDDSIGTGVFRLGADGEPFVAVEPVVTAEPSGDVAGSGDGSPTADVEDGADRG
ncbi:WXG100 family type VII secretion target [Agromyces albus]|uniref:WXG100 family type VII secretion target n=1 Tax=Agromyces albus TaxID=205332 RepID=A0A4Q2KWF0_9MICO|nr:WXG100 family type VII secretion target [Agromyces albus]RXZ69934.1 WXG100 family type VII secretion target [Agromyces albus]